jgi:energy-coupling factor transporter ATP-binding protein EcfA2
MEISGGFLPGFSLRFPRGLTCIIGPRGSGKSTFAEALRFGLAGPARVTQQGLLQANLGNANITITTVPESGINGYTIRRALKQPSVLLNTEGKPITTVELDRGTFLPLDAYTSREMEEIANETLGERRRNLLDELQDEQLRTVMNAVAEKRRALELNAAAIADARRMIDDLTEEIEEIGDARVKLAALPLPKGTGCEDLLRENKRLQAVEADARELAQIEIQAESIKSLLASFEKENKQRLQPPTVREESPCKNLVFEAEKIIEHFINTVASQCYAILKTSESTALDIKRVHAAIEEVRRKTAADASRLQQENSAMTQSLKERQRAEADVERLSSCEKRREAERKRLEELHNARQQLKAAYLLKREDISNLRENVARLLQEKIGDSVKLRVIRNSDNLAYQQLLLQGLKGARVRNHEEILATLMRLRPEQLAQIVRDNDSSELEALAGFGAERTGRILEAFKQTLDPLALEIIEIQDRITIELNVGTKTVPLFKDASELSQGQKCTTVLPLLLCRREMPLLIDQPEDNLDNHFIYETVVDTVRRLKAYRQMIFITHNANIPVLGGADMIVVMNSDGKKGYIQKMGTLDDCREEIIDLLEGGQEAFEARSKRYGR